MCLFGNSKELQLGLCGLVVSDEPGQRNRSEEGSFMDVRGAAVKEESIVKADILTQGSAHVEDRSRVPRMSSFYSGVIPLN